MSTVTYNQYSTAIKASYALGLEKTVIENTIREQIPYSTILYWRKNLNTTNIIGIEIEKDFDQNIDGIKAMLNPTNRVAFKICSAYSQFTLMLIGVLQRKDLIKALRKRKAELINCLESCSDFISYKQVSEWLTISQKTLYSWRHQVKFSCDASALFLCLKRHPNQATMQEVNVIRAYLNNPIYEHWKIHSIWGKAWKEGATRLSRGTWYHYNRLLNIRKFSKRGRKRKYNPIRAERINQIWHADITVFKTLDNVKWYIYTVMDNYSRFVYSWKIEREVSASIRLETVKEAMDIAFDRDNHEKVQFITDGGPENVNRTLKEFMDENQERIHHDIALQDIVQSNSMQESFYSILKYQYLYRLNLKTGEELKDAFEKMIHEYHYEKPHFALGIYTPDEVRKGADIKASLKDDYDQAAIARREQNKKVNCSAKCDK